MLRDRLSSPVKTEVEVKRYRETLEAVHKEIELTGFKTHLRVPSDRHADGGNGVRLLR